MLREDDAIDFHAYTFCVLSELRIALRRRDVFVAPSWRYADPRAGLLDSVEWESTRPIICRTLGLSAVPGPTLTALADELDRAYQAVAARLPDNQAVRFEGVVELIDARPKRPQFRSVFRFLPTPAYRSWSSCSVQTH